VRVARRMMSLGVVVALVCLLTSSQVEPVAGRVNVYGDSLSVQASAPISRLLADAGFTFESHSIGGTALCDELGQMRLDATRVTRPKVVVVAFIGNNQTPCVEHPDGSPLTGDALRERYAFDLKIVHDIWAPTHTPVVLLGAPATEDDDRLDYDEMLRSAASRYGFWYEDTTPDLSPDNRYVSSLPCAPYELASVGTCTGAVIDGVRHNVVRSPDGVHLCPDRSWVPSYDTPTCPVYASGEVRWAYHVLDGVRHAIPADS